MQKRWGLGLVLVAVIGLALVPAAGAHRTGYATGTSFGYAEGAPQGWLGLINLSGGNPACRPGRKVTVFKRRPGPDARVGTDISGRPAHDGDGFWQVETRLRAGRYYARVKPRNIGPDGHRHICRGTTTSTLRYPASR